MREKERGGRRGKGWEEKNWSPLCPAVHEDLKLIFLKNFNDQIQYMTVAF